MAYWRSSCAKGTRASSIAIVLCHHWHVILIALWRSKVVDWCSMASVALSELGHEVSIEHCLPHLHLLIGRHFVGSTVVATGAKATNPCLIENLVVLISLTVHIGKHVVNSRIICWLQHDASVSCVHLIYWQWSVSADNIATASLLSHSVSHEKGLIGFLRTEHSIDPLSGRLTLCTSKVLLDCMSFSCQRTVRHRVFIHSIVLEVWHHVRQPCLGRWFSSLLLNLVHLLEIFLGCRI